MSSIQVVLIKDVPALGQTGETVKVKSGYARNCLIPQKLATLPASDEAKEALRKIKEQKEAKVHRIEAKQEKKVKQEKKRQVMNARKAKLLAKK